MKKFFKKIRNTVNYRELCKLIKKNGQYLYPFMIKVSEKEWSRLPHSAKRFIEIKNGDEPSSENDILYTKHQSVGKYILYYKNRLRIAISHKGIRIYEYKSNYTDSKDTSVLFVLEASVPQSSLEPKILYVDKNYKEDGEWIKDFIDFFYTALGYQN